MAGLTEEPRLQCHHTRPRGSIFSNQQKNVSETSHLKPPYSARQAAARAISLDLYIHGLTHPQARKLAAAGVRTLVDLRDADLPFLLNKKIGASWEQCQSWQQQALLQSLFAGMGKKEAHDLIQSGIVSVAHIAALDLELATLKIAPAKCRAWQFIAKRIPGTLAPERLALAQEIEALAPQHAVSLFAQGVKSLQDLRATSWRELQREFLPALQKRDFLLWQNLAALRLDFGCGPAYALKLWQQCHGDDARIRRALNRVTPRTQRRPGTRTRGLPGTSGATGPAEVETALRPVYRELVRNIAAEHGKNAAALRRVQQWHTAEEIAGNILRRAARSTASEKAALLPWMFERGLTSKRGFLDLLTEAVSATAQQKDWLKALVAQVPLDNVLQLLPQTNAKDALLSLLTDAQGGRVADWQTLVSGAVKVKDLFAATIGKLLDNVQIDPAELVRTVLQTDEASQASGLQTVLQTLRDKQLYEKNSLLRALYQQGAALLSPVIKQLFAGGLEAFGRVEELLDVPLQSAPGQAQENFFAHLFSAIGGSGVASATGLDEMMSRVLAWVGADPNREAVSLADAALAGENTAAQVPRRVHLLGAGMQSFLQDYFHDLPAVEKFTTKFFEALQFQDELAQEIWLHLAKVPGMIVLLFPKLVHALKTPMKVFQWIGQDADKIKQKDRALKIHTLPSPMEGKCQYVIFSDVHRDAPDDRVDEDFFDLSHFSKNRDLFLRALRYYRDRGHLVVENGDCEELWVVPSVQKHAGVRARAERIIARDGIHHEVYELLAALHAQGLYFRTRGNHDDFWTLAPENEKILRDTWFTGGPVPFQVWDALIIPGVLTMEDDYLGVLKKIRTAKKRKEPVDVEELADLIPVGLTPERYRERKPLFIMHGHQTDFWNCDEHNEIGKILANSIGVVMDGMTTFPYHLRGIDFGGNPVVKFEDLMLKIPQVENWLPPDAAKRLSRQIEQAVTGRKIVDSVYYCETLTAALALALKYPGAKGLLQVQILVGHTHWPQSRPHLHLGKVEVPGLQKEVAIKLPTCYYNGGTCGWWEGVLWGVEITAYGQPKLFYWERNSQEPNYMPWELHGGTPRHVSRFKEKVKIFLAKCFKQTTALEENTQNVAAWEEVDDFSNVKQIDMRALAEDLRGPALSTAQVWALRHLEGRPQTSPRLEIVLDLSDLLRTAASQQKLSLVERALSSKEVVAQTLKALRLGREWARVEAQAKLYHYLGAIFFYAAHLLENERCNQMGLLLNLFISNEKAFFVRFDEEKNELAFRLGEVNA